MSDSVLLRPAAQTQGRCPPRLIFRSVGELRFGRFRLCVLDHGLFARTRYAPEPLNRT